MSFELEPAFKRLAGIGKKVVPTLGALSSLYGTPVIVDASELARTGCSVNGHPEIVITSGQGSIRIINQQTNRTYEIANFAGSITFRGGADLEISEGGNIFFSPRESTRYLINFRSTEGDLQAVEVRTPSRRACETPRFDGRRVYNPNPVDLSRVVTPVVDSNDSRSLRTAPRFDENPTTLTATRR